jgi:transcription-repair coupling factor (superfamily II helicase)
LFEVDSAKIVKQITPDCSIETDLAIIIPEDYVSNISERLSLYNELDNLKDENELALFVAKIEDRFGPMPNEVKDLIKTVRLRWVAEKLMFEKLSLKGKILKCQVNATIDASYFNGPSFGKILDYVKANPKKSSIKEQKDKLQITLEGVNTIETAITLLEGFLG